LLALAASSEGLRLAAEAYARFEATQRYTDDDTALLRAIFSSQDPKVLQWVGNIARQVARCDAALAVSS
jgi:hypothetical protein